MKHSGQTVDMLGGSLSGELLRFTLPIALSSMLQQLFNAADTSIVGLFEQENALAAVGTNAETVALVVTLSSGLAVGANLLIANRIGEGRKNRLPAAARTAVRLALIIGALGLIIGQLAARPLLLWIQTPEEILSAAEGYLRIYLAGCPFLMLYDFGAAILRARGDSRFPFMALVLSGAANVLLNLFFVLVFHMGVTGVALATDIATALSAALVLYRLHRDTLFSPSAKPCRRTWDDATQILKTGIPAAVQGAIFCVANLFVQSAVNRFGPTTIAGSTIAIHFEYFSYYVITAFGQTATTFTGQNHAAGQLGRCKSVLWRCLGFSTLFSLLMVAPVVAAPRFFAGLFSPEAPTVESACKRILCILLFEPLCNLYEIPAGVLRGTGHSLYPAVGTMVGTCAFRILWICTVFRAHPSPETLYHAFPLSWLATILLIVLGFVLLRPFAAKRTVRSDG